MKYSISQKGFTLTEMIISVSILLGLIGVGTASFVNFNERQTVEQAAKTLKNNLRLAQQNALSGVKIATRCAPNRNLTGWCVSPEDSSANPVTSYIIYGVCEYVNQTTGESDIETFPSSPLNVEMPKGVNVEMKAFNGSSWTSTNERLRFNALGEGVKMSQPVYSQLSYCVGGTFPSLANQVYRIRVLSSGEIVDDGFIQNCDVLPTP